MLLCVLKHLNMCLWTVIKYFRYLMERLYTNACTKNQGYVLDTLSYDIDSIKRIFLDGPEVTFIELLKDSESNVSVSEQQEGGSIKASTKKVSIVSSVDDIIDAEDVENEISQENSQKNISMKEEIRPGFYPKYYTLINGL